ncbi:MAG: methionine biosynthesis protein MetW [Lentisphaeria bacterium]|jgi:methionine biosynthesis protein MetW|nr:methionine biosynthesis protein MetW [Lentisphaeria bacterium]MDY0175346.1 methionine biosynthesis protein MetW [Lentisphaeria bacterium]NLZ60745.1 methionine biosynthesis protein MetW [Lentisphaerota bacterium]
MSEGLEQFSIAPGLLKVLNELGIESDLDSLRRVLERAGYLQARHRETAADLTARWQDAVIASMLLPGSSVLDIGCGEGDLLLRLADECQAFVQGVERDQEAVIRCIERGLPIYHSDLEKGLGSFQDQSFDYVILQNTVQTLYHALDVLRETLRIGRFAVISFPNFAHWLVRLVFSLGGRMPVTPALPYDWHNTPNIHLCSIEDFLDWCREDQVNILASWVLLEGKVLEYKPEHNLSAEEAVFLVESSQSKG